VNFSALVILSLTLAWGQLAPAGVLADASLWIQNKFQSQSCEDLNANDVSGIQATVQNASCITVTPAHQKARETSNEVSERFIFQYLADTQLTQNECELEKINFFEKDPVFIRKRAEQISERLPFLREQHQLANTTRHQLLTQQGKVNQAAGFCRNAMSSARSECYKMLEQEKEKEQNLTKKQKTHEALFQATLASLWQGSTETMADFIKEQMKMTPASSTDELEQGLKKIVPKVRTEFQKNKKDLVSQASIQNGKYVFDNLSDKTKRQLIQSGHAQDFLNKAARDQDPAMLKLFCRLEGQYTKGRDKLETAAGIATFALGGVAGVLSKVPLAARAGQLGLLSQKSKQVAQMAGAIAVGLDASVVSSAIYGACFSKGLDLDISASCPKSVDEAQKSELVIIDQGSCVLNALLGVAPAGIVAGSAAYKALQVNLNRTKEIKKLTGIDNPSKAEKRNYDAKAEVKSINERLDRRPTFDRNQISENQARGEEYLKKRKLDVSPTHPERIVDEAKIKTARGQLDIENNFFANRTRSIDSRIERSRVRKKERQAQIDKKNQEIEQYAKDDQELLRERETLTKDLELLRQKEKDPEHLDSRDARYALTSQIAQKNLRLKSIDSQRERISKNIETRKSEIERQQQGLSQIDEDIREFSEEYKQLEIEHTQTRSTLESSIQDLSSNPSLEVHRLPSSLELSASESAVKGYPISAENSLLLAETKTQRQVYTLNSIPKAKTKGDGFTEFWEHPQFARQYKELKQIGVEVVMDPQKTSGAFYHPSRKAVYLAPNAPYHIFEHEFTHAQFDAYIAHHIQADRKTLKPIFREGKSLREIADKHSLNLMDRRVGKHNIDYLDELLKTYSKPISVNESLAVHKQMQTLGWKPLKPDYHWNQIYGGFYRAQELLSVQKNGGTLNPHQTAVLNTELETLGANLALLRSTKSLQTSVTKIRQSIVSGRAPLTLGTWQQLQEQIKHSEQESTNERVFFNEQGKIIRLNNKTGTVEAGTLFRDLKK
jgi:hypothetical protein